MHFPIGFMSSENDTPLPGTWHAENIELKEVKGLRSSLGTKDFLTFPVSPASSGWNSLSEGLFLKPMQKERNFLQFPPGNWTLHQLKRIQLSSQGKSEECCQPRWTLLQAIVCSLSHSSLLKNIHYPSELPTPPPHSCLLCRGYLSLNHLALHWIDILYCSRAHLHIKKFMYFFSCSSVCCQFISVNLQRAGERFSLPLHLLQYRKLW